jgi:hypothetical protein
MTTIDSAPAAIQRVIECQGREVQLVGHESSGAFATWQFPVDGFAIIIRREYRGWSLFVAHGDMRLPVFLFRAAVRGVTRELTSLMPDLELDAEFLACGTDLPERLNYLWIMSLDLASRYEAEMRNILE